MVINLHFFIGSLLVNAVMDIEMLESPRESKKLMVGEMLELQWKYNVHGSARSSWKISLYVYNYTSNAKNKLIILQRSGKTVVRSPLPLVYQRLELEVSYDAARISIPTTTFDDTAGYGIAFEPSPWNNTVRPFEKVTDVRIVGKKSDVIDANSGAYGAILNFLNVIVYRLHMASKLIGLFALGCSFPEIVNVEPAATKWILYMLIAMFYGNQ